MSDRPDIVLTIRDESTGKEYIAAAYLGPLQYKDEEVNIHDLLDRPIIATRLTVVRREDDLSG